MENFCDVILMTTHNWFFEVLFTSESICKTTIWPTRSMQ